MMDLDFFLWTLLTQKGQEKQFWTPIFLQLKFFDFWMFNKVTMIGQKRRESNCYWYVDIQTLYFLKFFCDLTLLAQVYYFSIIEQF